MTSGEDPLATAGTRLGGGALPFERLRPLELLVSMPFGYVEAAGDPGPELGTPSQVAGRILPAVPHVPGRPDDPRAVLEELVARALARPPCVVQFSGGRDSSAILAVGVHVARRLGLPLPIPVTFRFIADAESDERPWQEQVIAHVGVDDWVRIEVTDELDLVGPVARRLLEAHGLVPPAPLYGMLVALEVARGGSRLTGEGGDEVLRARRAAPWLEVRRHPAAALHPGVWRGLGASVVPKSVRRARAAGRTARSLPLPWLRPDAYREVVAEIANETAGEPVSWPRAIRHMGRNRADHVLTVNARLLSELSEVVSLDPLIHPAFIDAVARRFAPFGVRNRAEALHELVGDLLPAPVVARQSKASFNGAYMTETARSFAREWSGRGVDDRLVDPDALRSEWLSARPSGLSFCLLQAAWLGDHGRPVEVAPDH